MAELKIDNNIAIFTFDNGFGNTVTLSVLRDLKKAVQEVNTNPDIKGLVLTGAGKLFSSGFDLPMFLGFKDHDEVVAFFEEEEEILLELFTCEKPVISAINGHCVAAGVILAMASDYRVVANHPKIKVGMSEIKIGLPLSICQSMVFRFGIDSDRRFRDIMYFGQFYDPITAKEIGLVDEVVDIEQVMPRSMELVKSWIDTPGRPFIPIKRSHKAAVATAIRQRILEDSWRENLKCFFADDVRQALTGVLQMMKLQAK